MTGKTKLKLHRPTRNDYPYGMVSPEARLVIGLRQSTSVDSAWIARELGCTARELKSFEKRIAKDEICGWVKLNKMPAGFGEQTKTAVQCDTCRNWIMHVPCVQCCDYRGGKCRNDSEPELPFDPLSTEAIPGSQEKIEVMRNRVDWGYSVFSPGDKCDFGPSNENKSE